MPLGDDADPFRERLYRAESEALVDGGRRFTRFVQIERFVNSVVTSQWWDETFPSAPIEIQVFRRSRGATFSAAVTDGVAEAGALWIRDGSWDLVTIVHELAHFATPDGDPSGPHGYWFVDSLLELWRHCMGFHAYGSLRSSLAAHGLTLRR